MSRINITVTGAAGQIAYALLPRLGEMASVQEDVSFSLRLLEVPGRLDALTGVMMELEDCAFPFIDEIICTADPKEAFADTHYALLIGAMPRSKGMTRADLLSANAGIFREQGAVLNAVADRNCQVLVVGNPCNTNAYLTMQAAPDLPKDHFFAMSMLDQHRAYGQLAKGLGVSVAEIDNLCVWGNHSDTMVADFYHATVAGVPIMEKYPEKETWCKETLLPTVATRGSEVIKMRGASSALSAANAALDSLFLLMDRDPDLGIFSLGVYSRGEYGAKPGTIVSYPCHFTEEGKLEIVQGLVHNEFIQTRLAKTFEELAREGESLTS